MRHYNLCFHKLGHRSPYDMNLQVTKLQPAFTEAPSDWLEGKPAPTLALYG